MQNHQQNYLSLQRYAENTYSPKANNMIRTNRTANQIPWL